MAADDALSVCRRVVAVKFFGGCGFGVCRKAGAVACAGEIEERLDELFSSADAPTVPDEARDLLHEEGNAFFDVEFIEFVVVHGGDDAGKCDAETFPERGDVVGFGLRLLEGVDLPELAFEVVVQLLGREFPLLFLRVLVVFRLREGIHRGGKQGGVVAEECAEGILLQLGRRGSCLPLDLLRDHVLHGGRLPCKFFAHHFREHFALPLFVRGCKFGGTAGAFLIGAVRGFVLCGRFQFACRLFRAFLHIRHHLCGACADLVDINHGLLLVCSVPLQYSTLFCRPQGGEAGFLRTKICSYFIFALFEPAGFAV